MSDFWSKRLGTPPAPAPQQPAAAPASTGPWWQGLTGAPTPQQATQPSADPRTLPPSMQNGEQRFGDLMQQTEYQSTRALSARDSERCPDCNSGNFIAPQGHPNAIKQCFDCGYNPRFMHTTHGVGSTGENVPTRTARGQTMSTNNFNPKQIVGRVA